MKKFPMHNYTVEVNVGRSIHTTVKAFSESHAAMIAERMLEKTGTQGFIASHEVWIDIEDLVRNPIRRPQKWRSSRWGYPWERLGTGRAALQASLNDLNKIKKMRDRHEVKARRAKRKDAS